MNEIFKFQRTGLNENGDVLGEFQATGLVPKFHEHLRLRGIDLDYALFNPDHHLN